MTGKDAFQSLYGFGRDDVSLENWRLSPFSSWTFQNVAEFVPTATIFAAQGETEAPVVDAAPLLGEAVAIGRESLTVDEFLRRSNTDALVVMKDGKFVADFHAPNHDPRARHIVFSISKSLTAILAGILESDGLIDPRASVTDYIPEARASAYGDATVRNLLDMSVSLDFEETDVDPDNAFGRYRRATLWNPQLPGREEESLLDFLISLQKGAAPHSGPFRYRSPNSDLLGIAIERASGRRYADFMSDRLWIPLSARSDASVTVDRKGTARAAGGVCVTARDLARVGEMMRCGGVAKGRRIVSETWIHNTLAGGSLEDWRQGDFPHLLQNGRYRNKWYQTGFASAAFFAIGIHGQWLYVDPTAEVVIAKLSSQPIPVDDRLDIDCLALFQAVSSMI